MGLLIYFDTKDKWNEVLEGIYKTLILAGPIVGVVISLIVTGMKIVTKIRKWQRRDKVQIYDKHIIRENPASIVGSMMASNQNVNISSTDNVNVRISIF